jgi:Uma2 family endonuclease
VSAQSIPRLYTVEEYERIPNPPGGRYELHHGELVLVTYPVRQHKLLQRRLRKMLEPAAEARQFVVDVEYPYRPLPESEVWGADVACVRAHREQSPDRWLSGSPELTVEVTSPSNTNDELHDKAMTTLAGEGAAEFWIVDAKTRTVRVYSKSAGVRIYQGSAEVPVSLLDITLALDEIFAE